MFIILFLTLLSALVSGHGKLVKPISRYGNDTPMQYTEEAPLPSDPVNSASWVCRHERKMHDEEPNPTWIAGSTVGIEWALTAAHVGDCDGYLSYDVDLPREDMRWFKIANWPNCKKDNNIELPMKLPDWIPSGQAVFRWGWYALHQVTSLEFYTQCADINIQSSATEFPEGLVTYTLVNPALFSNDVTASNGVANYRNGFPETGSGSQTWVTGPECGHPTGVEILDNFCPETAPGTQGHIAVSQSGGDPDIIPVVDTTSTTSTEGPIDPDTDTTTTTTTSEPNPVGDCSSGVFITISPVATDDWCQTTCSVDEGKWCDQSVCACSEDNDDSQNGSDDDQSGDDHDDQSGSDDNHAHEVIESCPSGSYKSHAATTDLDTWCQQTCVWNLDWCDVDVCYCEGGSGTVPTPEDDDVPDVAPEPEQTGGNPTTYRVIYINWRVDWNDIGSDVVDAIDRGFNIVILTFYLNQEQKAWDAALSWQNLDDSEKQEIVGYAHSKGARILISIGGETADFEGMISQGVSKATDYCSEVAQWAVENFLDGVDVDLELEPANSAPFADGSAIDFLVECSDVIRDVIGEDGFITHAPLAPYFGTWAAGTRNGVALKGYVDVALRAPHIDLFNIQYYNQGTHVYTSYEDLFISCSSFPGTAVKELIDAGIPKEKLIVGKPVAQDDAGSGWLPPSMIRDFAFEACFDERILWSSGIMGWQYAIGESAYISFAESVSGNLCQKALLAAALPADVIMPEENNQENDEEEGISLLVILLPVSAVLMLFGCVGYYALRNKKTDAQVGLIGQNYNQMV